MVREDGHDRRPRRGDRAARRRALLLAEYEDVFETIEREGLDSNISVKLTGLGLKLDHDFAGTTSPSSSRRRLRENFVRSTWRTPPRRPRRSRSTASFSTAVSTTSARALQAYMKRTLADVASVADLRPNVRVCKGIYVEPPEVAFQEFETAHRVRRGGRGAAGRWAYVGRHPRRVGHRRGADADRRAGLAPDQYEFQMLGVRPSWGRARARGASAADLRPVRASVVRVLHPSPAGEPQDRRLHRPDTLKRLKP